MNCGMSTDVFCRLTFCQVTFGSVIQVRQFNAQVVLAVAANVRVRSWSSRVERLSLSSSNRDSLHRTRRPMIRDFRLEKKRKKKK